MTKAQNQKIKVFDEMAKSHITISLRKVDT